MREFWKEWFPHRQKAAGTRRSPLRRIMNDWPWKLAALGVALIVFFGVRRSVSYTQTLTLTVEAEMTDGGQALTGFEPGVVAVTFRGSEAAIRRLSLPGAEPPRVRLRLHQPPPGVSRVRLALTRRDVSCDGGLRVVSIEPAHVVAFFDSSDTRALPVAEPVITGAPENGTVRVTIEPQTVEVIGSRVRLDELTAENIRLATANLDVSNRSEGFQTVLRVLPPDSRGGWTLRPDTVRADVRFVREDVERVFPEVPVQVLQSASGVRYLPETPTVEVTVFGPRRELATLDPESVVALVGEPEEKAPGANPLRCVPTIVLPCTNRVTRVSVRPAKVYLRPLPQKEELSE